MRRVKKNYTRHRVAQMRSSQSSLYSTVTSLRHANITMETYGKERDRNDVSEPKQMFFRIMSTVILNQKKPMEINV